MDVHIPRAVTTALRLRSIDVLKLTRIKRLSLMTTACCSGPRNLDASSSRKTRICYARGCHEECGVGSNSFRLDELKRYSGGLSIPKRIPARPPRSVRRPVGTRHDHHIPVR